MNFTDTKGNTWTVDVTVLTCKRVKKLLNIDLFDIEKFFKFVQDPISLCDVLYVTCKDEADKRGISDEQFGGLLGGTAIREARDALMEAYINFIPDPRGAEHVRGLRKKYEKIGEKIFQSLEIQMPEIMKQIDEQTDLLVAELEREIKKELNNEPNNEPNNVESVPNITGD